MELRKDLKVLSVKEFATRMDTFAGLFPIYPLKSSSVYRDLEQHACNFVS